MAAHVYLRMRAARRARSRPPSTAGFARRGSERATEGRAAHSTGRTTDFARAPRTPRRLARRAAPPPHGSSHAPQPPRPLPPPLAPRPIPRRAAWPCGPQGGGALPARRCGLASAPRRAPAAAAARRGGFGRTVRFDVSARALVSILVPITHGRVHFENARAARTRADLTRRTSFASHYHFHYV